MQRNTARGHRWAIASPLIVLIQHLIVSVAGYDPNGVVGNTSLIIIYPDVVDNISEPFTVTNTVDFLQSLNYGFGGGDFRVDGDCQNIANCCVGRACFGLNSGEEPYPESFSLVSGNSIATTFIHPLIGEESVCPKDYVFIGMAIDVVGVESMEDFVDDLDSDLGVENFRLRAKIQVETIIRGDFGLGENVESGKFSNGSYLTITVDSYLGCAGFVELTKYQYTMFFLDDFDIESGRGKITTACNNPTTSDLRFAFVKSAWRACGWNLFCPIYDENLYEIEDSADSAAANIILGDVLDEGFISTSSVVITLAVSLGNFVDLQSYPGTNSDCFRARADIDGNGVVDISDVTLTINTALNDMIDP